MSDTDKTNRVIRLLKNHYYANIVLLAVFFLLVFIRIIPLFSEGESVSVTAERYIIMITIIVIPVSLKFFSSRLKKLPRPLEAATAARKYKIAFLLRLYPVSLITLANILLFGITRNMNFFWLTLILFIVFIYCYPSRKELTELTETPPKENPPGEEGIEQFAKDAVEFSEDAERHKEEGGQFVEGNQQQHSANISPENE